MMPVSVSVLYLLHFDNLEFEIETLCIIRSYFRHLNIIALLKPSQYATKIFFDMMSG